MKFAYNVPGYVAGHRFCSDKRFFDSANNRFLDLAGFGRFDNSVDMTSGAAAFSTHGAYNREGLLLNNSNQWQLVNPIPWEGSCLVVAKPHLPTASKNTWMMQSGYDAAIATSNGLVAFQTDLSANVTMAAEAAGGGVVAATGIAKTQDQICLLAFSWDQQTRRGYNTSDGVTVNQSAADSATTNGRNLAFGGHNANGSYGLTGSLQDRMVRIGNNSGVNGDTAANATDYWWIFECHWWKRNPLLNNVAELKEFIDNLKAYYGIS